MSAQPGKTFTPTISLPRKKKNCKKTDNEHSEKVSTTQAIVVVLFGSKQLQLTKPTESKRYSSKNKKKKSIRH